MDSICGIDCSKCEMKDSCGGCLATKGRPFSGECVVAMCCLGNGYEHCNSCTPCKLKETLIAEFNALKIPDMPEVTELNALLGSFVNVEYTLANGAHIKLLDDNKIYLGNQLFKTGSEKCYGIVADRDYLLVCEYGANGVDPEIVLYERRDKMNEEKKCNCGPDCTCGCQEGKECTCEGECNCGSEENNCTCNEK